MNRKEFVEWLEDCLSESRSRMNKAMTTEEEMTQTILDCSNYQLGKINAFRKVIAKLNEQQESDE